MSVYVRGRWGRQVSSPSGAEIAEVLAELDGPEDPEHPDVSIGHESGWGLSAFPSGLVVWENVEDDDGPIGHLRDVPRDAVRDLFRAVAADDLSTVHAQEWLPGYG